MCSWWPSELFLFYENLSIICNILMKNSGGGESIGAYIRIGQEILCLPYVGFLKIIYCSEYSRLYLSKLDFDRQNIFLLYVPIFLFSGPYYALMTVCGKYIAIILWCVYIQQYWLPYGYSTQGTFLWLRPADEYIIDKYSLGRLLATGSSSCRGQRPVTVFVQYNIYVEE